MKVSAYSDIGPRRNQQDFYIADFPFFCVCDGAGGVGSEGALAAQLVATQFHTYVTTGKPLDSRSINNFTEQLTRKVARETDSLTTFIAAIFDSNRILILQVGDSLAVRLAGGKVLNCTRGHGVDNVLYNAFGDGYTEMHRYSMRPETGETLVLCSDGVLIKKNYNCKEYDMPTVSPHVQNILSQPDFTARDLVEASYLDNSRDNATAIVIHI